MIWGTQYCFYLTCFAGTVIVMFDFPLSCTTYLYWSAFKATGFDLELKMITNIQGYLYSISKKIALQVFYFIFFLLKRRFKFMQTAITDCHFNTVYIPCLVPCFFFIRVYDDTTIHFRDSGCWRHHS